MVRLIGVPLGYTNMCIWYCVYGIGVSLWNALVIIWTVKVFSRVEILVSVTFHVELGCLKFQNALSPKRNTLFKQKPSATSGSDVENLLKENPCRINSFQFIILLTSCENELQIVICGVHLYACNPINTAYIDFCFFFCFGFH